MITTFLESWVQIHQPHPGLNTVIGWFRKSLASTTDSQQNKESVGEKNTQTLDLTSHFLQITLTYMPTVKAGIVNVRRNLEKKSKQNFLHVLCMC